MLEELFCNSGPILELNTAQEVGSPRLENRESCWTRSYFFDLLGKDQGWWGLFAMPARITKTNSEGSCGRCLR